MRFFKMERDKTQKNAQYFLKNSSSSNSNSVLTNSSSNCSAMEVENDFMKISNLQYPTQSSEAAEYAEESRISRRLKMKIRSRSSLPPHDVWEQFHKAIRTNNLSKIIQMMRSKALDPNVMDNHCRTPLHMATTAGNFPVCEFLLKNGADPNQVDIIGNTPLHLAACSSKVEIVNLLLQNGAHCDILDASGFSPLTLATSKLKIMMSAIKKDPSSEKYQDIKKKCMDIIQMLDMCLCEKNLLSLQLTEFKSKIKEKAQTIDKTNDLENDVNDLLTSITALSIDSNIPSNSQ